MLSHAVYFVNKGPVPFSSPRFRIATAMRANEQSVAGDGQFWENPLRANEQRSVRDFARFARFARNSFWRTIHPLCSFARFARSIFSCIAG